MKMLFIAWCDSCTSRTWLDFTLLSPLLKHVTHFLTANSLAPTDQQSSVNINGDNFNYTPVLPTCSRDKCHFVRLASCCHLKDKNKIRWILARSFKLCCHASKTTSNITDQINKTPLLSGLSS